MEKVQSPLLYLTEKNKPKKAADKAPTSQNLQNKKPTKHRQGTDKGTAADIPQKGLRRFAHFGTRKFFTDKAYRQGHRQGTDKAPTRHQLDQKPRKEIDKSKTDKAKPTSLGERHRQGHRQGKTDKAPTRHRKTDKACQRQRFFFPLNIVIKKVDFRPIFGQLRPGRFDPFSGSWRFPVVTAGFASKFRAILASLC